MRIFDASGNVFFLDSGGSQGQRGISAGVLADVDLGLGSKQPAVLETRLMIVWGSVPQFADFIWFGILVSTVSVALLVMTATLRLESIILGSPCWGVEGNVGQRSCVLSLGECAA